MKVTIRRTTDEQVFRDACEATLRPGMTSKVSYRKMLQCEHSPIRAVRYWIKVEGIKSFVSVHLVRHKIGVEHYVQSNRDDRGGDAVVTRDTPIQHGMELDAQSIITISRKRLCLNSHRDTVATWTRVRKAMKDVDPDLYDFMVPECAARNGLCPELRPCKSGPSKVCSAYPQWPGTRA